MDSKEDKARRARVAAAKKAASVNVPRRGYPPPESPVPARTVDWGFWLNMPRVEVWQGCALSLNIDPAPFLVIEDLSAGDFPSSQAWGSFIKRNRLVVAHLGESDSSDVRVNAQLLQERCKVPLGAFVELAKKLEFNDMPPELAAVPGSVSSPPQHKAESPQSRRARLLKWHEEEVSGGGSLGAVERVFKREQKSNPKADRSYIGKQIRQAQAEREQAKKDGSLFSALPARKIRVP